jgi:cytochrome P450
VVHRANPERRVKAQPLPLPAITSFDALDVNIRAHPWPHYAWLQAEPGRRIYKLPQESNFYLVHRHEDVAAVLMDPDTYSSQIFRDREIPFFPMMKGAEHRRIRDAVQVLFTPRTTATLEPVVRGIVDQHTQALLAAGARGEVVELMDLWATRIPLQVIATLFGHAVDASSLAELRAQAVALNTEAFPVGGTGEREPHTFSWHERLRHAAELARALPHIAGLLHQLGIAGVRELNRYIGSSRLPPDAPRQAATHGNPAARKRQVIALIHRLAGLLQARLRAADDGSIASLLVARHRQGELGMVEMMMASLIILLAGYGTTSNLLACGVYRLACTDGLRERLRGDAAAINAFVEELLRCYGPLQRTARRVTRDVVLGGVALPAHSQLIVLLGGANVDAHRFRQPQAFDIARDDVRHHLAFGKGIHMCLGAPLARLQARAALTAFIEGVDGVEVDPATIAFITQRDTGMYGFERIGVRLSPAASASRA